MRKIEGLNFIVKDENMNSKTDLKAVAKAAMQATFTLIIVNAYQKGLAEPRYNVFVIGRAETIT